LIDHPSARALLFALAAAVALPAPAQVLYKLVDRQGRVTYSDSVPKNYEGQVTRIEPPDAVSNVVNSGKQVEAAPKAGSPPGMAETRRRTREELEAKLRAAQAKVEAARKAKAEGGDPQVDEMQTIQHRRAPLASGEQPPNANCFTATDPNGTAFLNCPTRIPDGSYYERQKKLDDDLKRAEEELALAERAYRRGTD
jgi:hypothetical protein